MSLRNRLWLVIGVLVVTPLLVGGVLLASLVSRSRTEQTSSELRVGARGVAAAMVNECRDLGLAARGLASTSENPRAAASALVDGGYADYAVVVGPAGVPVAEAGQRPAGVTPGSPDPPSCSRGADPDLALLLERTAIEGSPARTGTQVATVLDAAYLNRLAATLGIDATLTIGTDTHAVASTAPADVAADLVSAADGSAGTVRAGDQLGQAARAGALPWIVIAAQHEPTASVLLPGIVVVVALVLALALILGLLLARSLTRPLAELTSAAERVAAGELDQTIEVRSGGEVGRLGHAFNRMTAQLHRNVSALERSRDELRENLERLGEALVRTHDLEGLLRVVLQTARSTVGARGGLALVSDGSRGLGVVAVEGIVEQHLPIPERIEPGAGVLGRVFTTGRPFRGRLDPAGAVAEEPGVGEALAVPLRRSGRVVGVLALYGREDEYAFSAEDEDVLRTLAGQAGIAVDNVLLHREAQRLAITDPLTGLWNFRYLSMSLAREIERATRFGRPFAVLMLDLDHFKNVNDTWGHARGDSVLREFATRVGEQIREVDTLARYGGEEFVLVLPETGAEGAGMLADRICSAIRREPFGLGESEPPIDVTVSIGVATFPENGASAATLMRVADTALYAAKESGRNRWAPATV